MASGPDENGVVADQEESVRAFARAWRNEVEHGLLAHPDTGPDEVVVAVISDVHAVVAALGAVLHSARERGATQVWCLGDVVGRGPNPGACIRALRDLGPNLLTEWLVGNHEGMWLGLPESPRTGVRPDALDVINRHGRDLLDVTVGRVACTDDAAVCAPPATARGGRSRLVYDRWTWKMEAAAQPRHGGATAFLVHGGAPTQSDSAVDAYTTDILSVHQLRNYATKRSEDAGLGPPRIILAGHTHILDAWSINGDHLIRQPVEIGVETPINYDCFYLNVGSSGGWPRGWSPPRPTYGLLRFGASAVSWAVIDVEADLEPERELMISLDYPDSVVSSLASQGGVA